MHIDKVENGKIVEHWGQGDARGLMKQLGIIFLPRLFHSKFNPPRN